MGLFRKITAAIVGSTESDLIKGKQNVVYELNRLRHGNEAHALEKLIQSSYEQSIEQIIYRLGNAARHHAKMKSSDRIKSSPFLDRFIDYYCFEVFIKGFSLGYAISTDTADRQLQEKVGILVNDLNSKMRSEAKGFFAEIEVDCFQIAAHTAFELGAEAGKTLAGEKYIAIRR